MKHVTFAATVVALVLAAVVMLFGVTGAGAVPGNCLHWVYTFLYWAGYMPVYGWVWAC